MCPGLYVLPCVTYWHVSRTGMCHVLACVTYWHVLWHLNTGITDQVYMYVYVSQSGSICTCMYHSLALYLRVCITVWLYMYVYVSQSRSIYTCMYHSLALYVRVCIIIIIIIITNNLFTRSKSEPYRRIRVAV